MTPTEVIAIRKLKPSQSSLQEQDKPFIGLSALHADRKSKEEKFFMKK